MSRPSKADKKPKWKPICLRCDSRRFKTEERRILQIFKGRRLFVKTPAIVCTMCGWVTVGVDQLDELIKRTRAHQQALDAKAAKKRTRAT